MPTYRHSLSVSFLYSNGKSQMTEIVIEISGDVDAVLIYGVNNSNIQLMKNLCPKIAIMARGRVMKIQGEKENVAAFKKAYSRIEEYVKTHNCITEEKITEIVKGEEKEEVNDDDGLIMYGASGKRIAAKTQNQMKLKEDFGKKDMVFATGPAGSGKTYTAIALAVNALKNKQVRKIVLSRPAVEAGEKLGFLPGDMKEKIDPYLQPLYDALEDMIPGQKLREYMADGTIQIAPLAFMRGRTLNDAVIILDEAQNTTREQIKMFLTRMGMGSKMIITGDESQIDLPNSQRSGLTLAIQILKSIKGIGFVRFDKSDIVRHNLVRKIVDAFEKREKEDKNRP